jgi:hypothetical protein
MKEKNEELSRFDELSERLELEQLLWRPMKTNKAFKKLFLPKTKFYSYP